MRSQGIPASIRVARRTGVLLLGLAVQGVNPGTVLAQNNPSAQATSGLEEIVVTATRREERLQDVPLSVSAFTQEKMDAQGLRSIDDLTRLTPGVTFQRNGMGSSANYNDENSDINIRGIDSAAGTSTTGIYIDDTPVQSRHIGFGAVNVFPALFDLDRVEVLRGPQGTLFGAGAEGGAVRFINPEPGLKDSSGYDRAEFATTKHGDPSYELAAAAGGPIIDDVLGIRVSASYRRDGGYVDRVNYTLSPNNTVPLPTPVLGETTEQASNWWQTSTFRVALKWAVNDSVTITPSFYHQDFHINDTAAYWVSLSDPSTDAYRNGNALRNPSTDPFSLTAVKVDWNLDFAQLISNTAYYTRGQHSVSDYTQYLRATYASFALLPNGYPQAGDAGYATFGDKQNNFYQEIRLASKDKSSRLSWVTGVFYQRLNENIPENIYDRTLQPEILAFTAGAVDICAPPLQCPNGTIFAGPEQRVIDTQIALYGEATYRITDTFKVTGGLRISRASFTGTNFAGGSFLGSPNAGSSASSSEKPITPKLVLSYQPDHEDLYYFSAAKGYRVGGVNVGVGTICEGDLTSLGLPVGPDGLHHVPNGYSSDSLWSYEVGNKNTLFDHRLQINASLFVIDWSNIQQNVYLPSCGEQFTANLGKVQSRGGEIEISWRPVDAWTMGLSAAYTDAKFTKASCAGVLQFNGVYCAGAPPPQKPQPIVSESDRLVGSPWTVLASAEYDLPEFHGRRPYVRVDYQYAKTQTELLPGQNTANALHDESIPGLPTTRNLQLRAGMRWNGYDVSLFAQNLTDEHPVTFESRDIGNTTDNLYFARAVRPRTVGITATYRY